MVNHLLLVNGSVLGTHFLSEFPLVHLRQPEGLAACSVHLSFHSFHWMLGAPETRKVYGFFLWRKFFCFQYCSCWMPTFYLGIKKERCYASHKHRKQHESSPGGERRPLSSFRSSWRPLEPKTNKITIPSIVINTNLSQYVHSQLRQCLLTIEI
jgi:hypothetical protein